MKSVVAATAAFLLLGLCWTGSAQPEPWVHPDGSIHYYNAVPVPAGISWTTASDSAQRPGGYLATLTSQAENDFVFGLVDSARYWYQRPGSGDWAGPWLGGRQPFGSQEPDSGWEWVGGEPFGFRNWSPGEPDNEGNENVLNFGESPSGRVATWNDLSETDAAIRGYVVELSADSTTIGLLQNDTNAFVGYTLFESERSRTIFLIDNKGRYIHSWHSGYAPANTNYLLDDGRLLHAARLNNPVFNGGGTGGRIERYDWDGNLEKYWLYSDSFHCQHHDFEPLPNGNILLVAWELKTRAEAIAAGRNPAKITANKLWPDHLVEIDTATDSIVWEWHVWDHLIQDYDSTKANYGVVADHSELVDLNYTTTGSNGADWIHTNAVDYNPQLDQVVISANQMSEVWVIDHSTTTAEARGHSGGRSGMGGDLLYRWGNPQAYRAGSSADRKFYPQHDVRWIEPGLPGAGHIMVFNNGVARPGGRYSTVDEFIPDCDSTGRYNRPAPGSPFGPAAQCWIYKATPPASFYSMAISGAHRLPNGNTIIDEGGKGFFFEVTHDSQVVWRYRNPVTDTIRLFQGDTVPDGVGDKQSSTFRITRYAPDYPGLSGRNLTPGYPLERYSSPTVGLSGDAVQPGRPRVAISARPNPFRGSLLVTLDHLNTGALGRSRVCIFDASGRRVRSYSVPSSPAPRPLNLNWDGTDRSGRDLPAGAYLVVLDCGARRATTCVVLQR